MTNNGIVNIHGRDYVTVAKRIELGHEDKAIESIESEVIAHDPVVIRAKVVVKGQLYTGISSVSLNSPKLIEQQNPYEVAETSAVGRALGFAGFGVMDSIATADEVIRSNRAIKAGDSEEGSVQKAIMCKICGKEAKERSGKTSNGKAYKAIFCSSGINAHTVWTWQ